MSKLRIVPPAPPRPHPLDEGTYSNRPTVAPLGPEALERMMAFLQDQIDRQRAEVERPATDIGKAAARRRWKRRR